MNTRTNAAAENGAAVTENDTVGLSDEERAALAADPDEVANLNDATADLEVAAGGGEDDAEAKAAAAQKTVADKAAADKAAAEKAEAEAKADADNEEKAEAARVARETAEASAKAAADAQKASDDAKAEETRKAAAATSAAAEEDEPFVSVYTAPAVEDYDKKVGALDTRVKEASEKFKAGDISVDDYDAERAAVEKDRRDLDAAKLKADIASEQQVQTAEQRWQWEIGRFYRRVAKDEGVDYAKSSILNSALDTRVKELANVKENQDKDSTWFLEEAHRQVKAELGIGKKAAGDDAGTQAAAKAKADADAKAKLAREAAARRPARKDLPKDLGGLPAAGADSGVADDEFAALDALDGMELETALARMPKEKADRYLMGR